GYSWGLPICASHYSVDTGVHRVYLDSRRKTMTQTHNTFAGGNSPPSLTMKRFLLGSFLLKFILLTAVSAPAQTPPLTPKQQEFANYLIEHAPDNKMLFLDDNAYVDAGYEFISAF